MRKPDGDIGDGIIKETKKIGNGGWFKLHQKVAFLYKVYNAEKKIYFNCWHSDDPDAKSTSKNDLIETVIGYYEISEIDKLLPGMRGGDIYLYTFPSGTFKSFNVGDEDIYVYIEPKFIVEDMPQEELIGVAEKLNNEGKELFASGKCKEAIEVIKEALVTLRLCTIKDADACRAKFNQNLSILHNKLGQWEESLFFAERALQKDKDNIKSLLKKCEAEIQLRRLSEARMTLKTGLQKTNQDPEFRALEEKLNKLEYPCRSDAQ